MHQLASHLCCNLSSITVPNTPFRERHLEMERRYVIIQCITHSVFVYLFHDSNQVISLNCYCVVIILYCVSVFL